MSKSETPPVPLPTIVEAMLPQATEPAHEVPFPTDWPVGLASPEPDRYVVLAKDENTGRYWPYNGRHLDDTKEQAEEWVKAKYAEFGFPRKLYIARVATPELVQGPFGMPLSEMLTDPTDPPSPKPH